MTTSRRAWRSFLTAWGIDRFADVLWTVVLAWLAADAGSPIAQGAIVAAGVLPHLAFLLIGGAAADHRGSASMVKATTTAKALFLLVLAVGLQLETGSLIVLAVAAAAIGAADGLHDPAMESWGARLRTAEQQQSAATAQTTLWRLAQLSGAAVGGWLLGVGAIVPLCLAVFLFAAQRLLIISVPKDVVRSTSSTDGALESQVSVRERTSRGFGFLRCRPVLWATIGTQGVLTITSGAVLMLLVPRAIREAGGEPWTYGAAATVFATGMMLGAATANRLRHPMQFPVSGFVLTLLCPLPLLTITLGLGGDPGLIAAMFGYGSLLGPVGPMLGAFRREQTPHDLQGVVAGAARLVVTGPEALGPLGAGVAVALMGSWKPVMAACIGLTMLTGAIAGLWARKCAEATASSAGSSPVAEGQ